MAGYIPTQQENTGLYLPTTYTFDIGTLGEIGVNSQEFKDLIVQLYLNVNSIIQAINIKDSGYYVTQEFLNGQLWFNGSSSSLLDLRSDFRTTVNFGTLPNNGSKSVAHGIAFTSTYSVTRIYGAATNPTGLSYLALPYASASGANNIELLIDGTNVTITTASDRTAYTICYVVIEYLKN